jgi:hypothetical protein
MGMDEPLRVQLHCPVVGSFQELQAMFTTKDVMEELRRDVSFVGNAVVAVVFTAFAGLAVAAALYDLVSIHH